MNVKQKLVAVLTLVLLSSNAFAWEETLVAVPLAGISIIAGPLGLHQPGNMEVELEWASWSVGPKNWPCDGKYLTTLKSMDPDRAMLGILLAAQRNNINYNIRITDDPLFTAYPGRCSILGVQLRR